MVVKCQIKHTKLEISLQVPSLEVDQIAQCGVGHKVYHHILRLGSMIQIRVDHQQEIKGTFLYSSDANATFGACSLYRFSIFDTKVSVGFNLPFITSACKTEPTSMPVTDHRLGEIKISVLRDGYRMQWSCGKEMFDTLTGVGQTGMLADGSKIKVYIAEVSIDTPYFNGKTEALCMDNPIYDLIIGNIKSAREPNSLDSEWHVPLTEDSKHKTAFRTPRRLFQLRVMAFGLVSTPAKFSRLMRKLLKGMDNLDNFLNGILVFKETFESHLLILRQLFFKVEKCQINCKTIKVFHRIS